MAISRDDVLHVARLARLELSEAEITSMQRDLSQIVDYMAKLGELDTDGVPPTAQVAVEQAPLRDDAVRPGLTAEQALGEAPRRVESGFAVPGFVEE
ncbi:MAG TPA: Asp-tRNA(Asn)/Glu-tRNA(Gln) amidotransferase subunit GatC [Polyangiaceae bacterium]|nr:Asp-tRNA(Asn)/Glu-tRNA(Gln) amidotransferase subunit GatC [Polyangiaceae bacterium]